VRPGVRVVRHDAKVAVLVARRDVKAVAPLVSCGARRGSHGVLCGTFRISRMSRRGRRAIEPDVRIARIRLSDKNSRLQRGGRPSRDRAAAAAVAGHGTGRMIDHSVNWRHGTPAGRGHLFGQRSRAFPRAPQRVRGALAALGAGALVRRSPSLAGNARVPIRDRRMTFWDRPAPALADRSVLG